MKYAVHPVALLFPKLETAEREKLKTSIQQNGVHSPVAIWNKQIIDGRHRAEICEELGIEPPIKVFEGTEAEAVAFAWSLNDDRRHMTYEQRAFAAAKLANMQRGDNQHSGEVGSSEPTSPASSSKDQAVVSRRDAAKIAGVSPAAVKRAATIESKGTPELKAAVDAGTVSLFDAAKVAQEPAKVQRQAVAAVTSGQAQTMAKAIAPAPREASPVAEAVARLRKVIAGQPKSRVYEDGDSQAAYVKDLETVAHAYLAQKKDKGLTFTPPTVEEVKAYCREANIQIDADNFVDFYTSKGWKVGTVRMSDWRAACRTWGRNNRGRGNSQPETELQKLKRKYMS